MDFITKAIATAIEQGPRTVRDSQRSKCYAAERAAYPDRDGPGPLTIAECEKLANEMVEYARRVGIVGTWRRHPIRVADGRGRRAAGASWGGNEITLPRWARRVEVVAHEVAHCISPEQPPHGPHWVERFLRLIERFDGFEARQRLGAEMVKRGVRTRP
jgi:hypothetical protein